MECFFVNTAEVTLTTVRNCFRCGNEFQTESSGRLCPDCCSSKEERRKKLLNRNLSLRERQVVGLVCQAKLNKEIAYALHLTEGTIKEYLNRIYRKLGVGNRTELAIWALTTDPLERSGNSSLDAKTGVIGEPFIGTEFLGGETAA